MKNTSKISNPLKINLKQVKSSLKQPNAPRKLLKIEIPVGFVCQDCFLFKFFNLFLRCFLFFILSATISLKQVRSAFIYVLFFEQFQAYLQSVLE